MDNEDVRKLRFTRNIVELGDGLQFVHIHLLAINFRIVQISLALVELGMKLRD